MRNKEKAVHKTLIIFSLIFSHSLFANTNDLLVKSLKYLSSDELEGRRPGTPGNIAATKYLEKQLSEMGLKPMGESHLQEFTIFTKMIKVGANNLKYKNKEQPFEPISFSKTGKLLNKEIVFVGYGISIPENDPKLKYDDYEGLDVKDKIVVVLTGDPAIGNQKSPFRNPDYIGYQNLIYKLQNAAAKKASGIIVIQDPLSIEELEKEPAPYFNDQEGGGKRIDTLAGFSTNAWFNKILKASKTTTLELQKKISQSQKPASFVIPNEKIDLAVALKKETGRVSNVVGLIPGTDKEKSKEIIVLGAHFDHLGMGGQSSMEPSREPKIHNGADDNSSGTALILKLAQYFIKNPQPRSILINFFNAEEDGLLGSAHFVSNWKRYEKDYGKLYAMLNFDMVGRFDKEASLMGTGNAPEWKSLLKDILKKSEVPVRSTKLAVGSSDHASFTQNQIPALFITTGAHEDYHRSTDDFEKIDLKALKKLTTFSQKLVEKAADPKSTLTFDEKSLTDSDPGRNRGYGAHLGCVPKFGQADDVIGVFCTKASPNSPAEKAGIIEGDVVTQVGEVEIKNIYDLVFALRFYRSGDKVDLKWKRKNKEITKEITLSTRSNKKRHGGKSHHRPSTP